MEGGPPSFRPGFTCPVLLRFQSRRYPSCRIRGFHPLSPNFPDCSAKMIFDFVDWPYNPMNKSMVWALPTSLAATTGISSRFLFLCLLRCVTSAGLASPTLCVQVEMMEYYSHRISPFGIFRITASFQLPETYRRLARPSSPIDTKASTSSP